MNMKQTSFALAAASMLLAQGLLAQSPAASAVFAGYVGSGRVDTGVAFVKDKAAYGAYAGMSRPMSNMSFGLSVAGHNIDNDNTTADQQFSVSTGLVSSSASKVKWAAGIVRQMPNGDLSNYTEGGVRAGTKFGQYAVAGSIMYSDNAYGVADNTWTYSLGTGTKISNFDVAFTAYSVQSQSGNSSNLLGDNKWSGLLVKTAFTMPKIAKVGLAYDLNDSTATPDSGMLVATVGLGQFFGAAADKTVSAPRVGLASTTAF